MIDSLDYIHGMGIKVTLAGMKGKNDRLRWIS